MFMLSYVLRNNDLHNLLSSCKSWGVYMFHVHTLVYRLLHLV